MFQVNHFPLLLIVEWSRSHHSAIFFDCFVRNIFGGISNHVSQRFLVICLRDIGEEMGVRNWQVANFEFILLLWFFS